MQAQESETKNTKSKHDMKNAINYIIDNPYGEIFTLTSPNTGETKTIDREEAEGHLKYLPSVTFFSAKAEVNLKSVSCEKVS